MRQITSYSLQNHLAVAFASSLLYWKTPNMHMICPCAKSRRPSQLPWPPQHPPCPRRLRQGPRSPASMASRSMASRAASQSAALMSPQRSITRFVEIHICQHKFGFTTLDCAALRSAPFPSVPLYLAPWRRANVWFVCRLAAGLAVHGRHSKGFLLTEHSWLLRGPIFILFYRTNAPCTPNEHATRCWCSGGICSDSCHPRS
eukprot:355484-Chlamydomonas_euryale.AAC.3